jgi:hypothetical protein
LDQVVLPLSEARLVVRMETMEATQLLGRMLLLLEEVVPAVPTVVQGQARSQPPLASMMVVRLGVDLVRLVVVVVGMLWLLPEATR